MQNRTHDTGSWITYNAAGASSVDAMLLSLTCLSAYTIMYMYIGLKSSCFSNNPIDSLQVWSFSNAHRYWHFIVNPLCNDDKLHLYDVIRDRCEFIYRRKKERGRDEKGKKVCFNPDLACLHLNLEKVRKADHYLLIESGKWHAPDPLDSFLVL